jgi:hypothetical protein
MDGHLMFPIYGTLIIVINHRILISSHMKNNSVKDRSKLYVGHEIAS